ncbi:MAG: tRNA uridine-5-carboxymethylaminomethyl(34) synthesis GTPase MnmE [Pelagibacteraceae bacterium]|jgi:tRNA modification GTPase|nr:tRNA uridine-5-carboxymethylaminomethyl(34) synthesis GTPase MnmE [Pelagibacteraceae bacterium]MDP6710390.1 tRNA uridine-5-carboxymethylaminomethyl(34) synthesis GTPase MnmE [Pelagibacteraceae bacterium]|tara:strand:+ start:411 stop:1742 length:1332 start_codon:yes stop_codon:yes gene_type:complete
MTIYALSTGPGISGIAVIRVSGKNTTEVVKKITGSKLPKPRVATLVKFNKHKGKELIDEGVIIWFPAPNSYTGEDLAEFHVHGSRAVINAMHSFISRIKNCRLAEPGEFTKRAFQNGRINLLKAESIADLISAETEIQRKQALKIMSGKSSDKFNSWREKLLKILSHIEAKIDFPDEDLPKNIINEVKKTSNKVLTEIKKTLDDQKVGERIREGFKIAIVGPTNSGKSSLLNYLSKRDVAIVSEIAGTTRDVIETHLNLDGYPVIVSDTAGIRNSKNEIEKKGIKIALNRAEDADLKLVIVSVKKVDFANVLKDLLTKNAILVINKSDLLKGKLNSKFKKHEHVLISIKRDLNLDKLILKIKNKLKNKFTTSEDILITRERHRQNLINCVQHLEKFKKKNSSQDVDKAAEDLRLATRHLGMIVGKVDVEELLGSIFNDFCIGK